MRVNICEIFTLNTSIEGEISYKFQDIRTCDISKCVENISELVKFGDCPTIPRSPFERMCEDVCEGLDYNCPGVQKCCSHNCGWSCQEPNGLNKINCKKLL